MAKKYINDDTITENSIEAMNKQRDAVNDRK
jgi:hypothetical protein